MTKEEFLAGKLFHYIRDIKPRYRFIESNLTGLAGSIAFADMEHECNVEKVTDHYFVAYKIVLGEKFTKRYYFDKLHTNKTP